MEEQLLLMNEMDRRFKIGDEIEGEILSIKDGQLQISLVGYKSDGVIPFKELKRKVSSGEPVIVMTML